MADVVNSPVGGQDFGYVIRWKITYVDKTAYLARLIEDRTKTWFLARPRRFGKSLTVSALKSIFSGKKELFKGLAVEKRLGEERFAPRPVIHLDLSDTVISRDLESFEESLRDLTVDAANQLKVVARQNKPPATVLTDLITETYSKYKSEVVILIDEYDFPVTGLLDEPDKADSAREILREYYLKLKSRENYFYFIFVTGISKYARGGLYSAFNSPTDISQEPEYGAITGFTQDELERYYDSELETVARSQNVAKKSLLEDMKQYYYGFCFDGDTFLYNPFSTLQFFRKKMFDNFWYGSATPERLVNYLRKNRLTVHEFDKMEVSRNNIINPVLETRYDPAVFLQQLGYLSLRTGNSKQDYILDYPNTEVRMSLARSVLINDFQSAIEAKHVCKMVGEALTRRTPDTLVREFNRLLSKFSHSYFPPKHTNLTEELKTTLSPQPFEKLSEDFYRGKIFTLFYALGVVQQAEARGNLGRADFVLTYGGNTWVIEVKVNHKEEGDKTLVDTAMKRIKENNYAGGCDNPVLLGICINDNLRAVTWWRSEGGTAAGPDDVMDNPEDAD
ncbi:MAG: ATP-binding protein [Deltaproteobacteria bacterium]|jgi:hypothetical protein|nr:ATP-binding protein [Deltaproteobacteria bacterium]